MGIVFADGVAADKDGVALRSDLVNPVARMGSGDPGAMSGGGSDFAVQSHGIFQDAEGTLIQNSVNEGFVEGSAGFFFNADGDGNTMRSDFFDSAACD